MVRKSIKKYNDLIQERDTGKLDKYTKKEKLHFEKEIAKMESRFGGISDLKKMPDALFVWDVKTEKIAVEEARRKNIPVVAVCDTSVNPELVNYPIPANDDATKGVKMVLDLVKKTIQQAQNNK